MSTQDTAGTAREGMTMDTEHGELARIIGDVRRAERERDAATERAERAERERDDLAATLETRTAEHALAMARVTELEARLEFADRGLKTLTDAGWELATERDRLRAIIAGRATPPTDAEIEAHFRATGHDGRWRLRRGALDLVGTFSSTVLGDALTATDARWWPLDADGCPCAWPAAEVSRG